MYHASSCARTATFQSASKTRRIASDVSKKSRELPHSLRGAQHDVSSRQRAFLRRLALIARTAPAASGTK